LDDSPRKLNATIMSAINIPRLKMKEWNGASENSTVAYLPANIACACNDTHPQEK
jgi:hypothetical protein